MIDESRVVYDGGPVGQIVLAFDVLIPVHLRFMVRLDHEIDGELLREAWERTKRVYPIIDTVLEFDGGDVNSYRDPAWREQHDPGHVYLMKPTGGCNVPLRSKVPVSPCTDAVGGRLFAVSYYGDTIWVSSLHVLADGGGSLKVCSTLLYSYLALHTGHEDEHPVVELREGRALEDYYIPIDREALLTEDYTPVPVYAPPAGVHGFHDEGMRNEEGTLLTGSMSIDAQDFMRLCKSNGANPSAMLGILLGRAAYALNPDQQESLVLQYTMSARAALGLEDSIANVASGGFTSATRDEVMHGPLSEVSQRIRSEIATQRTRDYVVSYTKHIYIEGGSIPVDPFIITYMGRYSIGDNDRHILDMGLVSDNAGTLYLFQTNDHFVLSPCYGLATQKYLDEFARIFEELGVRAQITEPAHPVDADAQAPAL